jgi:hypothetical protein
MRLAAAAALCLVLAASAHADERWSDEACKSVGDLETFYYNSSPDLTSKAWAVRPLLVLERDHCGVDVKMKIEESEKVIKLRLWPVHVCEALAKTKGVRTMLARQLDEHCSENAIAQDKAAK